MDWQRGTLLRIYQHARAAFPCECCGVILRRHPWERVRRVRNCLSTVEALHSYRMDAVQLASVLDEAQKKRWDVAAIYHSHPMGTATFSARDARHAMAGGEPLLPDLAHVIVALDSMDIRGVRTFCWDAAAGAFR